MKKFLAAALTAAMMLSLAACGKTGLSDAGNDWVNEDEDIEVYENQAGSSTYEGKIGSTLKTTWFDFTVTDAYVTDEDLGGYSVSDGNRLLVVEVKLKNTYGDPVPMWDDDFWIEWGDDGDGAYPIDVNETITDDQLPDEYELGSKETKTGTIIFEVPDDVEDFAFVFLEYFDDNTEGNYFAVYFTADEK